MHENGGLYMITISLCMIVKNEEAVLSRCLDSIADLMDEIIIVDTGSVDRTKEIAAGYTSHIYDFAWNGSFADARNYSFSKASCQYIYCADADEVIDEENRARFRLLKKGLLPEIDIVQMYYCNQLSYNTIYNYDREYRPKLYKRLRTFTWCNPIHETVSLEPVIYDSDIEIQHRPTGQHASRDLKAFEQMYKDGVRLSSHLHTLYAKELLIAGEKADLENAIPAFIETTKDDTRSAEEKMEAYCILARAYRLGDEVGNFFKYTTKAVTSEGDGCAEICLELGLHYMAQNDFEEALIWLNAALQAPCILSLKARHEAAVRLSECYKKLGFPKEAEFYEQSADKL